jgi:hypothetical protein
MENFTRTDRTSVRRLPKRASYDRALVYRILDEGFVCHVGFVSGAQPFVIPTAYGRVGDTLYLHGARASRMLKALAAGAEACVTVTLVDGLVLARGVSSFAELPLGRRLRSRLRGRRHARETRRDARLLRAPHPRSLV